MISLLKVFNMFNLNLISKKIDNSFESLFKSNKKFPKRILLITSIIFLFFCSYIMIHHVTNALYTERFEGYFLSIVDLYFNGKTDLDQFAIFPFWYQNLALDQNLPLKLAQMKLSESFFPNFFMLFISISLLTGLSPQLLMTLPLGLFFIPFIYVNVIKSFINYKLDIPNTALISSMLFIFYLFYLGITRYYGSFYVAPVTMALFLTSVFCINKILKKNDLRYFILMCFIIISLVYYWHTMFMQLIFFIIAISIVYCFFYFLKEKKIFRFQWETLNQNKQLFFLILFSLIIAMGFSQLWRSSYARAFYTEANLPEFISNAVLKFTGNTPFSVPYIFNYKISFLGMVYFISLQMILFLSLIILLASILFWLKLSLEKRKIIVTNSLIMGISIVLTQIILVVSYYKTDSLSFALVPLFFPLFGIAIIFSFSNEIESEIINYWISLRRIIILFLGLMIILAILCNSSLYLTNEAGSTSITKYSDAKSSFYWLNNKLIPGSEVIVDFNIIGKFGQLEAKESYFYLEYEDLTPKKYQTLVGDIKVDSRLRGSYSVIDRITMENGLPVHITSNRALLQEKIIQIDNSDNQLKIYEDDFISIYQFL